MGDSHGYIDGKHNDKARSFGGVQFDTIPAVGRPVDPLTRCFQSENPEKS
jgi:hypothetical protein